MRRYQDDLLAGSDKHHHWEAVQEELSFGVTNLGVLRCLFWQVHRGREETGPQSCNDSIVQSKPRTCLAFPKYHRDPGILLRMALGRMEATEAQSRLWDKAHSSKHCLKLEPGPENWGSALECPRRTSAQTGIQAAFAGQSVF